MLTNELPEERNHSHRQHSQRDREHHRRPCIHKSLSIVGRLRQLIASQFFQLPRPKYHSQFRTFCENIFKQRI